MTVYVETNFVLELALLQEQHTSCEQIVGLAAEGRIRLVIPAYSLVEPHETLIRFFKKRQVITEEVRTELRQLGRSAPYEEQTAALEELTALFIRSQEEERHRLQQVLEQLLALAVLIPLSAAIIRDAHAYQQQGFSPQDAVVYASVLSHLTSHEDEERVFLNRNSKDFDDPDVQDQLEGLGCNMLFRFDDGLGYIQHRLRRQDG